jgi:hypothetical protein
MMLARSLTLQRAVRLTVRASSAHLSLRAVYTRLTSGNFLFPQAALAELPACAKESHTSLHGGCSSALLS